MGCSRARDRTSLQKLCHVKCHGIVFFKKIPFTFHEFHLKLFLSAFTLGGCSERPQGPSFEGSGDLKIQRAPGFGVRSGCHHSFAVFRTYDLSIPKHEGQRAFSR